MVTWALCHLSARSKYFPKYLCLSIGKIGDGHFSNARILQEGLATESICEQRQTDYFLVNLKPVCHKNMATMPYQASTFCPTKCLINSHRVPTKTQKTTFVNCLVFFAFHPRMPFFQIVCGFIFEKNL